MKNIKFKLLWSVQQMPSSEYIQQLIYILQLKTENKWIERNLLILFIEIFIHWN